MLLITGVDILGLDPEIRQTLYKLKTQCQVHGADLVVTTTHEILNTIKKREGKQDESD